MYSKYQLIVIALLLSLALSIVPTTSKEEQSGHSPNKQHTSTPAQKKTGSAKSSKAPQVSKKVISHPKNQKKQVATSEQSKHTSETANKITNKQSTKEKQKPQPTKNINKQIEKTLGVKGTQAQSPKTAPNEIQIQKALAMNQYQKHNFWVLFSVYSIIVAILAYGVKYVYFPQSNNPFELVLDIVIKLKELNFNNKNRGYKAPEYHQEVDDSKSITVGYAQDRGKQLFWQKNSVQGI